MQTTLRTGLVLAGLAAVTIAALITLGGSAVDQRAAAEPTDVVVASFPGLVAATGEPELPSLQEVRPSPGVVVQAAGPFYDRFELSRLKFENAKVSGIVQITSDVSDLLELEVVAGFYDRGGRLLGTARFVHHVTGDEPAHSGPPSETKEFEITAPAALVDSAVSVAVGVPVLVNE